MNFTVIDFEKLNEQQVSVCEVAMVKYADGEEIGTYHKLINPIGGIHRNIGGYKLKHISDAELAQASTFAELFDEMKAFIGDDILVCHQVSADINYIYNCEKAIERENLYHNGYVDTMEIAKHTLNCAGLTESLAAINAPVLPSEHEALADAKNCATLFLYLQNHFDIPKYIHTEKYIPVSERPKSDKFTNKSTLDLPFSDALLDSYSFAGKSVVVSGDFTERKWVEQKIVALGAKHASGFSGKTSAFIVADNAGPSKIEKAKALKAARPDTFHIFHADSFVKKYK